jgi:signal transduction histidine kinase
VLAGDPAHPGLADLEQLRVWRSSYVTERLIGDVATVRAFIDWADRHCDVSALHGLRLAEAHFSPHTVMRVARQASEAADLCRRLGENGLGLLGGERLGLVRGFVTSLGPVNVLTDRHASVIAGADGLTVYDNIAGKFNVTGWREDERGVVATSPEGEVTLGHGHAARLLQKMAPGLRVALPGADHGVDEPGLQVDSANDVIKGQEVLLDRVLVGVVLASLLIIALFVFRPATRQVGLSIAELERAEEQQRELAALKDQFIIDANHELRTPIMALYNNLELLSLVERRNRDDPVLRKDLIQQAVSSGDGLLRLLSNVLDVGALDSQHTRMTPTLVRLEPLVRTTLDTFDPREIGEAELAPGTYQARVVTMSVPSDMVVWCDEGRLRQVLINLISNALKYSEAGTPIDITAQDSTKALVARGRRQEMTDLQYVRLSVRDRGLGVPPGRASQLFQRFVRLPRDIAGPVRGTGVGLYLCRTYIEAMGGEIGLESSGVPGEGSTFSFTLPLPVVDANRDQDRFTTSKADSH